MCGIAGILDQDGAPIERGEIAAMCDLIRHRGPDEDGYFVQPGIALGMRRLSIIDLAGGTQPITNEDGTVQVVFNGEIYNYRSLRRDLEARGHRFATGSDTETIAHLYEEYGPDLARELRGMFAFALWDVRRRRLVIGRDRLGIKPLYYSQAGHRLFFASELKALVHRKEISKELDWASVNHVFTSMTVPRGRTILASVKTLDPGHVLVASPGRPLEIRRYWDVNFAASRGYSEQQAAEALRHELHESVGLHMLSDVPVGAFLSGGLDSSAVVALMRAHAGEPIRTFSIGFAEPEFDERPYARAVAEALGTRHTEFVLEPNVEDLLDDIVWHLDEPFGDSSAIPTYMVSKMAASEVKVVLSGDGGDELFAGYDKYRVEGHERSLPSLPSPVRAGLRFLAAVMPDEMKGRNFVFHHSLSGWDRYLDASTLFKPRARARLFSRDVVSRLASDDPWRHAREVLSSVDGHWLSAIQYLDLQAYLPLDILTKVDRMSMAHSLEVRVPLLDHKVVETAASMPPALHMAGGVGKRVFREAMRGVLPDITLTRRKQGFAVPLGHWFRGRLEGLARDLLLSERSRQRGIFDPQYLERVLSWHAAGRPLDLQIWTLMSFELWCRQFLDGVAWARDPRPAPASARRDAGRAVAVTAIAAGDASCLS